MAIGFLAHLALLTLSCSLAISHRVAIDAFRLRSSAPQTNVLKVLPESAVDTSSSTPMLSSSFITSPPALTRREYLSAIRNRLYAAEERIWLSEYAEANRLNDGTALSEDQRRELLASRESLLREYPLAQLTKDRHDAQRYSLHFASYHISRLIRGFLRQLPLSLHHHNTICAVRKDSVQLIRGNGRCYHLLQIKPPSLPGFAKSPGQYQRTFHPVFSPSGKHLAIAETYTSPKTTLFAHTRILVFEVPSSADKFGRSPSTPVFVSAAMGFVPRKMSFSPSDDSLLLECFTPNVEGGYSGVYILEWAQHVNAPKQGLGKALEITRATFGSACFSAWEHNTTVLLASPPESLLGDNKVRYLPYGGPFVGHTAGGGDNMLAVDEAGRVVSIPLSRWKRCPPKALHAIRASHVKLKVSRDSRTAIVLEHFGNTSTTQLTVLEGEEALDPMSPVRPQPYSIATSTAVLDCWFSPDSSKLLLLLAGSEEDELCWKVYNLLSHEMRGYDRFHPTRDFLQALQMGIQPWSPDSKGFVYTDQEGLVHCPLHGTAAPSTSLGQDRWIAPGVLVAVWG